MISRRTILTAAPAMALATPVAGSAASPLVNLCREHLSLKTAAAKYVTDHSGAVEDEESETLFFNRMNEIEAEMKAMPSHSAADFAAKMLVEVSHGCHADQWETAAVWREARQLVGTPLT